MGRDHAGLCRGHNKRQGTMEGLKERTEVTEQGNRKKTGKER